MAHVCPECDEPAVKKAATKKPNKVLLPITSKRILKRMEWSHLDGQPLCPVMGPHGYEPAEPKKV